MTSIAFLIPGIDRLAGAESQVMLLVQGLQKRGWRVTVIALSGSGGESASALAASGVGFLTLGMRKGLADLRGWLRLHRWLRRNHPDIVHAHLPHATWMARLSRPFAPVRVQLDTIHTAVPATPLQRRLYRWTRRLPDRVTFVSVDALNGHEASGMVLPVGATIVPNGIDTDEWRPLNSARAAIRSEIGLPEGFLWLAAGRLEPIKDHVALLRAFAQLPAEARLAIAGSGSQEQALRALSGSLGIAGRVRFLGFRSDIRRLMQTADAFVLSSLCEGLPVSLLEAGACGLPSVATDVPGTREVLADAATGFLAFPVNPESLRAAMLRVMEMSPEERHAIGLNARARVVERYRLDLVLDQWERLYAKLLESSPHSRRRAGTA